MKYCIRKLLLPLIYLIQALVTIFIEYVGFKKYLAAMYASIILVTALYWRHALTLTLICSLVGFTAEYISLNTGYPFGEYYYNMKPDILGVPAYVLVMWGIFIYISYTAFRSLVEKPYSLILAEILMVIQDLALDPMMTRWRAWVWTCRTELNWYGIPWTNFLGWFIVSLLSLAIYHLIHRREKWNADSMLAVAPYLAHLTMYYMYTKGTRAEEPVLYALILALATITPLWIKKYKLKLSFSA